MHPSNIIYVTMTLVVLTHTSVIGQTIVNEYVNNCNKTEAEDGNNMVSPTADEATTTEFLCNPLTYDIMFWIGIIPFLLAVVGILISMLVTRWRWWKLRGPGPRPPYVKTWAGWIPRDEFEAKEAKKLDKRSDQSWLAWDPGSVPDDCNWYFWDPEGRGKQRYLEQRERSVLHNISRWLHLDENRYSNAKRNDLTKKDMAPHTRCRRPRSESFRPVVSGALQNPYNLPGFEDDSIHRHRVIGEALSDPDADDTEEDDRQASTEEARSFALRSSQYVGQTRGILANEWHNPRALFSNYRGKCTQTVDISTRRHTSPTPIPTLPSLNRKESTKRATSEGWLFAQGQPQDQCRRGFRCTIDASSGTAEDDTENAKITKRRQQDSSSFPGRAASFARAWSRPNQHPS